MIESLCDVVDLSDDIQKYVESNVSLIDTGKAGKILSQRFRFWIQYLIKEKHDLSIRNDILNLLTKEYSLY